MLLINSVLRRYVITRVRIYFYLKTEQKKKIMLNFYLLLDIKEKILILSIIFDINFFINLKNKHFFNKTENSV